VLNIPEILESAQHPDISESLADQFYKWLACLDNGITIRCLAV